MEIIRKIEDLVAPLVGLGTAETQPEGGLKPVTDPEGIIEDEYCMDGRKNAPNPAEIAKRNAQVDLGASPGELCGRIPGQCSART